MRAAALLALAERALSLAPTELLGEAQATAVHERSLSARFARSAPTQATGIEDVSVEITCFREGQVGSASTNALDDDALLSACRRAAAAAEALARGGTGTHPGLGAVAPPSAHEGFDAVTAALDPAAAGSALRTVFSTADDFGLQAFGIWTAGAVQTAIATTAGAAVVDRVTDVHLHLLCRDADGHSGYAQATGSSLPALDAAALTSHAAAKVRSGEPRRMLSPGEYTVVFEPEAVGVLLDWLGMIAFNGLAHAEGAGALSGLLGTSVAAPGVTVSDAPLSPLGLPRAFDAEGTPRSHLTLIAGGVAKAVAHDRRSAAVAGDGALSTGHALLPGGDPDGPRPTNLTMSGGDAASLDALLAPVERGVYVTRLWYVNAIDPKRTLLTGMSRDGTFLIEDGRLSDPLHDVRFTDSALRLLAATEALTRDQRLVAEAEFYGTRFAFGQLCPALRASAFRVTGSTV